MKNLTTLILASLFVLIGNLTALADSIKIGDLMINNPVARATAPGAKVGAGYLTITNHGKTSDRLIGGTTDFAKKIDVHEMKMTDSEMSVMKMQPVEGGLEIKPGETVKLVPGGYHLMFMKLSEPLKEGEHRKAILTFEKAGKIEVMFNVISIAESLKMKDNMKHDH